MRTSTRLMLAGGLAGALAAGAVLLAAGLVLENRAMRRECERLQHERDRAAGVSQRQSDELAEAQRLREHQQGRVAQLEKELAALRAQATEVGTNGPLKAVRTSLYLGQEFVGQGWLIPERGNGGPAGGARKEATVVLDESLRARFSGGQRESARSEEARWLTVNHNYPQPTWGYYGWPYYWVVSTGSCTNGGANGNSRFPSPPAKVLPADPPNHSSGIWKPTEKPFLPSPSPWPIMTPPQRIKAPPAHGPNPTPQSFPAPATPTSVRSLR